MPDCGTYDLACKFQQGVGNAVGSVAGSVGSSVLNEVRQGAVDMTVTTLKTLGTFWLKVPSPSLSVQPGTGTAGGDSGSSLGVLQSNLAYFTLLAAVFGLIVCAARMAITAQGEHGGEAVKMLVRLVGVAGAGAALVSLLVASGDAFAPWIIGQATGTTFEQAAPNIIGSAALTEMTPLLAILIAVFALFGAVAQVLFMILRGGLLLVLVAVWPLAASLSSTEQGLNWYKKISAYLIAFVLLKPVASILYAAGFLLLKDGNATTSNDPTVNAVMGTLQGLALLTVSALALPALLRFVTPMTSAGSGSMSGGAALAGTVAAGAAVVTMGAGAAAAGAGGGGATSGTGGQATGSAATSGGTSSAAGGGGSGGPSGGSPSGGGSGGGDGDGSSSGAGGGGSAPEPPPSSAGGSQRPQPVPAGVVARFAAGGQQAVRAWTAAAENAATDHSEPSGARHEQQS